MSWNTRHQWHVPVPRLLGHGKWWTERHKRGSPWNCESGTRSDQKPPADARTFCRTSWHRKESASSSSRQCSSNSRRVSWRVGRKSGYKHIKMLGTYHGQLQTLCIPSQLQSNINHRLSNINHRLRSIWSVKYFVDHHDLVGVWTLFYPWQKVQWTNLTWTCISFKTSIAGRQNYHKIGPNQKTLCADFLSNW